MQVAKMIWGSKNKLSCISVHFWQRMAVQQVTIHCWVNDAWLKSRIAPCIIWWVVCTLHTKWQLNWEKPDQYSPHLNRIIITSHLCALPVQVWTTCFQHPPNEKSLRQCCADAWDNFLGTRFVVQMKLTAGVMGCKRLVWCDSLETAWYHLILFSAGKVKKKEDQQTKNTWRSMDSIKKDDKKVT